MSECLNCEERDSNEQGVLCDECRAEMWEERHTHQGSIDRAMMQR